jgi:hypothetical protein
MIASLFAILLGTLLIAVAIAWVVGPVRLLAGLVAVPIMWAIVLVAVAATWLVVRSHGGV